MHLKNGCDVTRLKRNPYIIKLKEKDLWPNLVGHAKRFLQFEKPFGDHLQGSSSFECQPMPRPIAKLRGDLIGRAWILDWSPPGAAHHAPCEAAQSPAGVRGHTARPPPLSAVDLGTAGAALSSHAIQSPKFVRPR